MTHRAGTPHISSAVLSPTHAVAVLRRLLTPVMLRVGFAAVLEVRGRRTGTPRDVSVIPTELAGTSYLVSMHGDAGWVRDIRAAGQAALRRKGGPEPFTATEVYGNERDVVIAAYVARLPRPFEADFNRRPSAGDHPVFRMDALDGSQTAVLSGRPSVAAR